jgi:hypothetical protein
MKQRREIIQYMNKLKIGELAQEGFSIRVVDTEDSVLVRFEGSIDIQEPQYVIEEYFNLIHSKMIEIGLKTIYCDFNNLQYINSSGIKCLLKWILQNYQEKNQDKRYSFVFIINDALKWQADGIGFLKKIAPELISISNRMPWRSSSHCDSVINPNAAAELVGNIWPESLPGRMRLGAGPAL